MDTHKDDTVVLSDKDSVELKNKDIDDGGEGGEKSATEMSIASSSDMDLDEEDLELIRSASLPTAMEGDDHVTVARRNKKRVIEDSDSEPDEPDMTGKVPVKKQQRSLESMFSDDEDDRVDGSKAVSDAASSTSSDELDDFIEDEEAIKEQTTTTTSKQQPRTAALWGSHLNISKSAWNDLMDIFGDGTDYADLVWEQDGDEPDEGEDVEDEEIVTSTYQHIITRLDNHHLWFEEEARFLHAQLKRHYNTDTDPSVVVAVLQLLVEKEFTVPYIAAFCKDAVHPLSLYHLWFIHDWHTYYVGLKRMALTVPSVKTVDNADIVVEWVRRLPSSGNEFDTLVGEFEANVKAWTPLYNNQQECVEEDRLLSALLSSQAIDLIVKRIEAAVLVSVNITESGKRLGTRHPFAHLLSVQLKPLESFHSVDLMLLSKAVGERWCTVSFSTDVAGLIEQLSQLLPVTPSPTTVITSLVQGLMERIHQRILLRASRDGEAFVADSCAFELQSRLVDAPFNQAFTCVSVVGKQVVVVGVSESTSSSDIHQISQFDNRQIDQILAACQDSETVIVSGQGQLPLVIRSRLLQNNKQVLFASDDVARVSPKRLCDIIAGAHHQQSPAVRHAMAVAIRFRDPTLAVSVLSDTELCQLPDLHQHQSIIDRDLLVTRLRRAIANASCFHVHHSHPQHPQVVKIAKDSFKSPVDVCLEVMVAGEHLPMVRQMLIDAYSPDSPQALPDKMTVLAQPQPLLALDLADYDRHLGGRVLKQLQWYRSALLSDCNQQAGRELMAVDRVYLMLSGVTRQDQLQPGQLIRVFIPHNTASMPSASSANGYLEASQLPVKIMLADGRRRDSNNNNVGVILSVNYGELDVDRPESLQRVMRVSVHPDDLKDPLRPIHADQWYRPVSDTAHAKADASSQDRQSQSRSNTIPPSILHHPLFKPDIHSKQQAEASLSGSVAGDAILWAPPNSAAVLSWRCCMGVVLCGHWTVSTDGHGFSVTTGTSSSASKFEDVDEIVARGVEPCARLLDQVVTCPKYIAIDSNGNDALVSKQVESQLSEQLQRQPGRVAYGFWLSRDSPGTVYLCIAPRHHEPIVIVDGEFVFRRSRFRTIAAVVDHMKRA